MEIVCPLCRNPNLSKVAQNVGEFYGKNQRFVCECGLISNFNLDKIVYSNGQYVSMI
jgi:transposase-like protein